MLGSLENKASTSDPVADVACPQSILGKTSSEVQSKAVRSRVTSGVEGAEKRSWLWASTLDVCNKNYQCKVIMINIKIHLLTEFNLI